ncbi:MAG: right-handed parallel beta-helix repeat-containing protein [Planctomycetota bacterium]|jgi:hypothetical protein
MHFLTMLLSSTCALVPSTALSGDQVLFVDRNANGPSQDGLSWCTAFRGLDEALAIAGPGTVVKVADGTYTPSLSATEDSRDASFVIPTGVDLRGGFAGCGAANPDARDVQIFHTRLSGDLNDDDAANFGNRFDNVFHVVVTHDVDESTVIDGFTISGGQADGPNVGPSVESRDQGAGINNYHGSPRIRHCTFRDNYAANHGALNDHGQAVLESCRFIANASGTLGAGLYIHFDSHTVVDSCVFQHNHALGKGGGVYIRGLSMASFTDCLFQSNRAFRGAGMYCDNGAEASLSRCVFRYNRAEGTESFGGGMYVDQASQPVLEDCLFDQNVVSGSESGGGGMYNIDFSHPSMTRCRFVGNRAERYGGGLYNTEGSSPTLFDCIFQGNSVVNGAGAGLEDNTHGGETPISGGGGGLLNVADSNPYLFNCLFSRNFVAIHGGGVYNYNASPTFVNCTVTENTAGALGGGIFNRGADSNPELFNDILWGNVDSTALLEGAQLLVTTEKANPAINYNCVEGWSQTLGGVGNHGSDPKLVNGPSGCFYLEQNGVVDDPDNPCVDSGNDTASALGLAGYTTAFSESPDLGIVDMGWHYQITGNRTFEGDWDRDGAITLLDIQGLQLCFAPIPNKSASSCCGIFDLDADHDVDLGDYELIRRSMDRP